MSPQKRPSTVRPGLPSLALASTALLLAAPAISGLLAADPAIVFVSRQVPVAVAPNRTIPVERGTQGRLLIRSSQGVVSVLLDAQKPGAAPGTPADFLQPEVSYDGARILFSGFVEAEGAWRIFEVKVDGTELRQLTQSDRDVDLARFGEAASRLESYDDLDPCYLGDGRICFVSTRYPGVAPDERARATNLHVMNSDGTGLHRITTERFGADTPTVEPSTGRIVYSRWWRTAQPLQQTGSLPEPIPPGSPGYGDGGNGQDPTRPTITPNILESVDGSQFPGVNSWFLSSINPNGTGLQMHSGFRIDREATQAYMPAFEADGSAIALFIPQTPILGMPGKNGLRRFSKGASVPVALGGPQTFGGSNVFPGGGGGRDGEVPVPLPPEFGGIVYASAVPMPDGRILVSGALDGGVNYDIYVQGADGSGPVPLVTIPQSAEMDAVPIVSRPVPPALADGEIVHMSDNVPASLEEARIAGGTFKFICENIHSNAALDVAIANAPPVGKKLSIEFFMVPQRTSVAAADPPILVGAREIGPDGRVEMELPAGVPLFELLRRPDGSIAQGRDGQIFHVGGMNFGEQGKDARCVGCHAGHSMMEIPLAENLAWTNIAPSSIVGDGQKENAADDFPPDVMDPRGLFSLNPQSLVDRRTDPIISEWSAGLVQPSYQLSFRWSTPVRGRELAVYGASSSLKGDPAAGIPADQALQRPIVKAFTVTTFLGTAAREEFLVRQDVLPAGVKATLNESLEFDRMVLSIQQTDVYNPQGDFQIGPALAEVEVMGRSGAAAGTPMVSYVRADADCSSFVNISDPVVTLAGLFLGQPLCCSAAADSNGDDQLNISDPITTLRWLFLGADEPPSPSPSVGCGLMPEGDLLCNQEACF